MKIKIKPEKILGKETRLDLEKDIVYKMIGMYCRGQGHSKKADQTGQAAEPAEETARSPEPDYCHEPALCQACTALYDYALERLDDCPFGEDKTFCSQCQIHCYAPEKREEIRRVMAWSGPRMIFHHPLMAIIYLVKKKF